MFAFAVNWARLAILGPISQIEEFRFWKMAIGLLASLERTQGNDRKGVSSINGNVVAS